MIKKAAVLVFLLIVNFQLLIPTVFAQTATSTPKTSQDRLKSVKENRKQAVTEAKSDLKTKMDTFKAQIKTLKDERKKMLTERIADRTATANAQLTSRMDKALDHLTEILNRLKTRSQDFKTQGKDTTALDKAIADAETAILTAQTAVDTQKTQEYSASITDESTLKNTIGQMVSEFRQDIKVVHKLLVDAKQAVQKGIMEAAKLRETENTATGSASI